MGGVDSKFLIVRMIGTHLKKNRQQNGKFPPTQRNREPKKKQHETTPLAGRSLTNSQASPQNWKNPAYRSSSWAVTSWAPLLMWFKLGMTVYYPIYKERYDIPMIRIPYDPTSKMECDKGLEGCWVDMENYLSFDWVVYSCMHPTWCRIRSFHQ